jgi:general secretion pathway protein C
MSGFKDEKISLQAGKPKVNLLSTAFPTDIDVNEINDADFFGRYNHAKKTDKDKFRFKVGGLGITDDVTHNAPESHFSGKITGILLSADDNKCLVIIEHAGRQASYSIGERIPDSHAVILKIFKGKILLDEDGYYKSMTIKE